MRWGFRGLLMLAVAGYTAVLFWACVLKYRTFAYIDFDLAIHAQSVWNILHGKFDSSILGIPFLGNHSVFILFLIAPVYALFQSPLTLLFFQTAILASGALALYLIAERDAGPFFGFCLAIAYLLYPALVYMSLAEFHPVALATGFLLWAVWSWQRRRWRSFFVWLFLSFLCQENVALVGVTLGLYTLFFRECRKIGAAVIGISLIWFSWLVFWFLPWLNQGRIEYLGLYRHLGDTLPEIFGYLLTHPVELAKVVVDKRHWGYYLKLFAPLGFLPFAGIDALVLAGPIFLEGLLSARPTERAIFHHYTALLIPFIFWAAALAGRRIARYSTRIPLFLGVLLLICTAMTNVLFGVGRRLPERGPELLQRSNVNKLKKEWVERIPPEDSVIASFPFLAHLAHRRRLYSFHHVYSGTYTLSRQPYRIQGEVQYALLDFDDWITFRIFKREGAAERMSSFFVEKKLRPSRWIENPAFYEQNPPLPSYDTRRGKGQKKPLAILGPLELLHVSKDSQEGRPGEPLFFEFRWRLGRGDIPGEHELLYEYRDEKGKPSHRKQRPFCAGVYPPHRWKKGEVVIERHALLLPETLAAGKYTLWVGMEDSLLPVVSFRVGSE